MDGNRAGDEQPELAAFLDEERQRALEQWARRAEEYEAVSAAAMTEGRDDEHDPDGSTPAIEYALAHGLLVAAQAHLADVNHAIVRLGSGTYGRCKHCGAMIGSERLAALPTAVTCIGCAVRLNPRRGRSR